jgi:RNase adaptor protein for sRNA GlmZ degradation
MTGPNVNLVSFGYLFGAAPAADITVDLRVHFRDPHTDPALRGLTAADQAVTRAVLATPGVPLLCDAIAATAMAYRAWPSLKPVTVAIGCAGGRHRSAVVAEDVATLLDVDGVPVTVVHRDMHRPVSRRGGGS